MIQPELVYVWSGRGDLGAAQQPTSPHSFSSNGGLFFFNKQGSNVYIGTVGGRAAVFSSAVFIYIPSIKRTPADECVWVTTWLFYFPFPTAWSPALRSGDIWHHWLEFDFLAVAKIARVRVENQVNIAGEEFRPPVRVMVQSSDSPGMGFVDVQEIATGGTEHVVDVVARYVRLVILEVANQAEEESLQIGVSGYEKKKIGLTGVTDWCEGEE